MLADLDHQLFLWLHRDLSNPVFDLIFPHITDLHQTVLGPVLLCIGLISWVYHRRANGLKQIALLILAVAITDATSHHLIKKNVQRDRPRIAGLDVQLKTRPHAGFSFPSNHAANNFAAATLLSAFFPPYRWMFLSFAALVALSRVYVGVHFPLDIIGGAILGSCIAGIVIFTLRRGRFRIFA